MSAPEIVEPGSDDSPVEADVRAVIRAWMDEHAAPFGRNHGTPKRQVD